jgi:pimeloyl-ACP methyl ester carboxylesterase
MARRHRIQSLRRGAPFDDEINRSATLNPMPRAALPSGIELEYSTTGNPSDPPLLAVNGYTSQMISWPRGYVEALVAQGLFVIQFDNRDVGLSTKLDGQRVSPGAVLAAALEGRALPPVPYTLSDMAADAIGLLDHLGIDRAHIVGNSMGGMIVQTMAIEHPTRIASVTSVMSSTGDPRIGRPTPEAREALLAPSPPDRNDYIAASLNSLIWASRKHGDAAWLQEVAAAQYDRCFYPEGATRQLAAIYASGDRSDGLAQLDVPMLVIHGRDDTLITPEGGERTAELVAGSRYLLLSDMGHDHPAPLWPVLAEAIGGHVRVAHATSSSHHSNRS